MKKIFSSFYLKKIFEYGKKHKILSTIVIIVLGGLVYGGIRIIQNESPTTRYILDTVKKGTIQMTVSGSGQVSATNQVEVKAKASGDVTYIAFKNGATVQAGAVIAQLDSKEAVKAVRDAEVNLKSAEISLEKLKKPADTLSLIQAENSLAQSKSNLEKSYDDGFTNVSNAFLDLPLVMTGLEDILYGNTVNKSGGQDNISAYTDLVKNSDERIYIFRDDALAKYAAAKKAFETNFIHYRNENRLSSDEKIEELILETYSTTKSTADAVKSIGDLLSFVENDLAERNQDIPPALTTHKASLSSYTSKTGNHLSSLLSIKDSITSSKFAITEKEESLRELKQGADTLDIQSSELTIRQRQNALADAREKLADYSIRAPFTGTIADISIKRLDSVSNGMAVATLITKEKVAEMSLNEIDVSKVSVGDRATLTFDALEDITMDGEVVEIDAIGTATQGVVNYIVKIKFGNNSELIKPGMSVSALIVTEELTGVITVPNSAIKSENRVSYVEIPGVALLEDEVKNSMGILLENPPQRKIIEVGKSNDESSEIVSGLKEGDVIIIRTISQTNSSGAQAPTIFGAVNQNGGARSGGAVRTNIAR